MQECVKESSALFTCADRASPALATKDYVRVFPPNNVVNKIMNTRDIYTWINNLKKNETFHWRKGLIKFIYEHGGKLRLHDNLLWNKMMYFLICVTIEKKG